MKVTNKANLIRGLSFEMKRCCLSFNFLFFLQFVRKTAEMLQMFKCHYSPVQKCEVKPALNPTEGH